jgi:peptide deformylase
MSDVYEIVKVPSPVLKETAADIENITTDIQMQAEKMVNTMYEGRGIGLAANQVGILNRMFVMDLPEGSWQYGEEIDGILTIEAGYRSGEGTSVTERKPSVFINPEVVWSSEQESVYEEGCLSIPQQYAAIIRPASVKVKFQDLDGTTQEKSFEGLDAACVQHEIDHLNGVLFIDYLSPLKRNMILKKVRKINKDASAL